MDHYQALKDSKNHLDRCAIAIDNKCPPELLAMFINHDTEYEVVEAAALNLTCSQDLIEKAIFRFPQIGSAEFELKKGRRKQEYLSAKLQELQKEQGAINFDDRDEIIRKQILKENYIDHASSHLGISAEEFRARKLVHFVNPAIEWAETDKFKIALIIAPAWGVLFPPYNIAKLTGLLRNQKYSVKAYDLNIEAYHRLRGMHGEDYWRSERYFLWLDKTNFETYLLPDLEEMFNQIVEDLARDKPKVVGFSIYNTNNHATMYLLERLKKVLPDTCFIAGGPEMAERYNNGFSFPVEFNYIFVGEAEENLINFLDNLPSPENYEQAKVIGATVHSRLNLDIYAYPDYSDYNLSNYQEQTGISAETSRGCVAQCSFCSETYYWKFRSLSPERTVAEIEHQVATYGIKRVWFVDSLINGDLKSFQKLVRLIVEKNIKIIWNSYARCDGRMTKEFFQEVAQSGCNCLSFGVESGSQKILDNMRKKIEVWEIENNLKDAKAVDIFTHINWMVGFPTEEALDWMHSLQLLFNCRKWISAISVGYGAGSAPGSHMKTNPEYYGISPHTFLNNWRDENYTNTGLHRFLRIKLTHIWLALINKYTDSEIIDSITYTTLDRFFQVSDLATPGTEYLTYDNYVYLKNDSFAESIESEYLAFFYIMYRYFGKFSMTLISDPVSDMETFGKFIASNYTATVTFSIDENGEYSYSIDHKLLHTSNDRDRENIYSYERTIADMSFARHETGTGNINSWVSDTFQTKPPIKEHRKKTIKQVK